MRIDPARRAAFELLTAVRRDDAYANLTMPGLLRTHALDGRDAAFATELGYGTLRWQGLYDAILSACITRDWTDVEPPVRDILRLGAHQLLSMRVPTHAAIDSSCELARGAGNPGSATGRTGFVNAVLRKVAARSRDEWISHLEMGGSDVASLATRTSHPAWIVRAFQDALGTRRSEIESLLDADNVPARPMLVARPGRLSVDELRAIPTTEPGRWSPYSALLTAGSPESQAVVADGRAGVQDEGSQLVALALARTPIEGSDALWLDMCAGPGGKAALLAGLAGERGATLVAVEQHAHRAALVEQALGTGAPVEVITGDANSRPWGARVFDRVLADVPCTGLGALRRRPESRWRRTTDDLTSLGPLQRALLATAIDAARPGGVIAYVTCSPHLAETEFVVRDVMKRSGSAQLLDARAQLPEVPDCGDGPFVQLWPHRHGTDAMFLALLQRTQ